MYENRFKRFLVEQDVETPELTDDQAAMQQTLDKDTNISDFDANVPNVPAGEATMTSIQKKMYEDLKQWIARLDEFSTYLNGTGPESIQSKLNSAESDTLFDKISTAETKKIARVAVEISSLSEMLKGYLATANDPKYKYT
jgi:hypothetical protein